MTLQVLTGEPLAQLLAQYPHQTNAELGRAFGLHPRQVQHLGQLAGVLKTPATRSRAARERHAGVEPLMQRVERLVLAAGSAGVCIERATAALPGEPATAVRNCLFRLTSNRRVFRGGLKRLSSWFGSQADAQAWTDLALRRLISNRTGRGLDVSLAPALQDNAPVTIAAAVPPAYAPGAPVIPPHVRVQVGHAVPGPEGRWHTEAEPIFARLRPGQYPEAPSRWAAAATGVAA